MFFHQNLGRRNEERAKLAAKRCRASWRMKRPSLPIEIDQQIVWEALRDAITPSTTLINEDPLGPIAPLRAASKGQTETQIEENADLRTVQVVEVSSDLAEKLYLEELRPEVDRINACSAPLFLRSLREISRGFLCHDNVLTMLHPLRRLQSLIQQHVAKYTAICVALEEKVKVAPGTNGGQQLPPETKVVACRHAADVPCLDNRYNLGLWRIDEADVIIASCALRTYMRIWDQVAFLRSAGLEVGRFIEELDASQEEEVLCA